MVSGENNVDNFSNKDEINIVELLFNLWHYRKIIIKFTIIIFIIGLILRIGSPKEYKSEITVVIESGDQSSSLIQQFAGLAGMAGTSLPGNEDALTPEMYPDIVISDIFLLELMNVKVTETTGNKKLLYEYINHNKKSLIGFIANTPAKLIKFITGDTLEPFQDYNFNSRIIRLSKAENNIIENLRSQINIEINKTSKGILGKASINPLKISVNQQDPYIAKQLADTIVKKLSSFIIVYRTNKARVDLSFIIERTEDAKKLFHGAQTELALFKDRNQNTITARIQSDLDILQTDYNLKYNTYNNLCIQLEQAKIKVQQSTPALQIIEPSEIPFKKDKPKTLLILGISIFVGFFIGLTYVIFSKILLKELIEKFKSIKH
jgi:LPS O-antigen subunit length determinant protein (WzzB/FepE family)